MIDIIVPFYNDSDDKWRNIMYDYMAKEGSNDRQVVGEERYRDWGNFKYFFRGIENNCPWVNKVFLVIASETQIPKWLNIKNPKLRIVYHKEFIPEELLPTFNPMTIGMYFANIKDLSDNYVICDDDYFFLNPTTAGMFFVDDYPVYRDNAEELIKFGAYWLESSDGTFYKVLNNGMDLQQKIAGDKSHWYSLEHLPVPHKKNFEKKILDENYDYILNANKTSRFRNENNLCNHVYNCLYRDINGSYYKFNSYYKSYYLTVKKDTNFEEHGHCQMICFNDTEQLSKEDFMEVKNRMLNFFENKFPNKSSFEK